MAKITSLRPKPKTLKPIRPNAGIRDWYQSRLEDDVDFMCRSFEYWLAAEYRKTGLTQDANPAILMKWAVRRLIKKWQKHFDQQADSMAHRFVDKTLDYGGRALKRQIQQEGMTIKFQMTESMRTAYEAVVAENVNLIKSIPTHYGVQVETAVMQSVSRGRDLGYLTGRLEKEFGVTKRRAAFIARDQNNKATSVMQAQRQMDLGITEGVWRHSGAGKEPRPSHVAANDETFKLSEGKLIDGEYIMPGQKPGCRCIWEAVLPTLEDTK